MTLPDLQDEPPWIQSMLRRVGWRYDYEFTDVSELIVALKVRERD